MNKFDNTLMTVCSSLLINLCVTMDDFVHSYCCTKLPMRYIACHYACVPVPSCSACRSTRDLTTKCHLESQDVMQTYARFLLLPFTWQIFSFTPSETRSVRYSTHSENGFLESNKTFRTCTNEIFVVARKLLLVARLQISFVQRVVFESRIFSSSKTNYR